MNVALRSGQVAAISKGNSTGLSGASARAPVPVPPTVNAAGAGRLSLAETPSTYAIDARTPVRW